MKRLIQLSIVLNLLFVVASESAQNGELPILGTSQFDFYPIIFIHGFGTGNDIEDTWKYHIEKNFQTNQENPYINQGIIWDGTSNNLPTNGLPPNSMFRFGYYRHNSNQNFGDTPGRIGGITVLNNTSSCMEPDPAQKGKYRVSGNGYQWHNIQRMEYSKMLGTVVDDVLRATGSRKVILVAHSMGGLVARAYIEWAGGADKVYKLLTVATPNSGIPGDIRLTFAKMFNSAPWQQCGELDEMSTAGVFSGRSFTSYLNDGWVSFSKLHNIRYATIRGNYNPWIVGSIGDGVVDESSAQLDQAEFNGVVYAAHMDSFPPFIARSYPSELSIIKSVYTSEVIKRWGIENIVEIGNAFVKYGNNNRYFVPAPNPSDGKFILDYELTTRSSVALQLFVHSINGDLLYAYGYPLYSGINQPIFSIKELANGGYLYYIKAYDMNGNIINESQKLAKITGSIPNRPIIKVITGPKSPKTSETNPSFLFTSNVNDTKYSYKLDDGNWSTYSQANSSTGYLVNLTNLQSGTHILYVSGFSQTQGYTENPAVITWIVDRK